MNGNGHARDDDQDRQPDYEPISWPKRHGGGETVSVDRKPVKTGYRFENAMGCDRGQCETG
jgi:hypothetical protein